jgi:hypothetical protein
MPCDDFQNYPQRGVKSNPRLFLAREFFAFEESP